LLNVLTKSVVSGSMQSFHMAYSSKVTLHVIVRDYLNIKFVIRVFFYQQ